MGEVPFTQVGHTLPEGCSVSQVSQNFTMFSFLGLCTSYVSCSFSMSSQSLSVASHWWSCVISASQFEHMDFLEGTGVKTSGAGKGRPFKQGEIEDRGFSYYTPWGPPPSPPPKSDKTLYTGIYLPTFREGTNFIIKLLVSCLGALTGPGGGPP